MPKVFKLSMNGLKKVIGEERRALQEDLGPIRDAPKKPDREVDADEFADTLTMRVDWQKKAKIKEARIIKNLKKLREGMRHNVKRIKARKGQGK